MRTINTKMKASTLLAAGLMLASCGSDVAEQSTESAADQVETAPVGDDAADGVAAEEDVSASLSEGLIEFEIEVWADNWMAVYVNGELIGEDSVPITTERSFNAETFTFTAAFPFAVAIEAKDFKETDSGIEYIGEPKQQMGDGGIIAQVTNATTGEVVGSTDSSWSTLVIHRAPLNTECVSDADPDETCDYEIIETPAGWADPGFDDGSWSSATEWSAADVGPKDGYDDISWDSSAKLVWGIDLEIDNTILLRSTISR